MSNLAISALQARHHALSTAVGKVRGEADWHRAEDRRKCLEAANMETEMRDIEAAIKKLKEAG